MKNCCNWIAASNSALQTRDLAVETTYYLRQFLKRSAKLGCLPWPLLRIIAGSSHFRKRPDAEQRTNSTARIAGPLEAAHIAWFLRFAVTLMAACTATADFALDAVLLWATSGHVATKRNGRWSSRPPSLGDIRHLSTRRLETR